MQHLNAHRDILNSIAQTLLEDQDDFYELKKAIEQWKSLLNDLIELDLSEEKFRENIHSQTGKAIGTTWAAMCLDDLMRTKKFIKGIFLAIDDLLKKTAHRPICILYAGCGPFAPLVQLLTTKYAPSELQFILLEINEHSFSHVSKLFSELNLESYLKSIHLGDATTIQLEDAEKIDLVISETMQHALVREQQVPITFNILSQVREDVLLIPQSIELTIGLLSARRNHQRMLADSPQQDYFHHLGTFFDLSQQEFKKHEAAFDQFSEIYRFPEFEFSLENVDLEVFDQLAVFTQIHIYGDQFLRINESQLALPLILQPLEPGRFQTVKVNYKVDADPGIEYQLS